MTRMDSIGALCVSLAVLGIALGGFAWILGLKSVRDRLFRFAAGCFGVGVLLLPLLRALLLRGRDAIQDAELPDLHVSTPLLVLVLLGHAVLAVVLLRRRLRGPEHARRVSAEIERVRSRERARLPPDIEGPPS